jgi:hypothetical protein
MATGASGIRCRRRACGVDGRSCLIDREAVAYDGNSFNLRRYRKDMVILCRLWAKALQAL